MSPLESFVAQVWQQVLSISRPLQLWDRFALLGGDSLAALRVVKRLRENLSAPSEGIVDAAFGHVTGPLAPIYVLQSDLRSYCAHLSSFSISSQQSDSGGSKGLSDEMQEIKKETTIVENPDLLTAETKGRQEEYTPPPQGTREDFDAGQVYEALVEAAGTGQEEVVRCLLSQCGIDLNQGVFLVPSILV